MRPTSSTRLASPLVAAFTALTLVSACGGGTPEQQQATAPVGEPQRGGTVTYSFSGDASNLDAARCGTGDWLACSAIYGTLLNYNAADQKFEPGMAESFETEDGRTWTLKLRQNVKFTDGTAFDAEAVKFNWERAADPKNLSPGALVAKSMTLTVVDPLTLRAELKEPNFQLRWALQGELAMIGSPAAIQQKGPDFANEPVGAGPFKLQSWARGSQMILVRNDGYWDQPRPYVDRFVIKVLNADDQRLNALRTGEIDVMATTRGEFGKKGVDAGFQLAELNYILGSGIRMSFTKGDLADPDIRKAVAHLADGDQMIKAFYPGETVARTLAPQSSWIYDPEAKLPTHDVAEAQRLVDGYLARTGKSEVTIAYKYIGGSAFSDGQAQMIQAMLQQAKGVKVELVSQDYATWFADTQRGDYQLQSFAVSGVNPDQLHNYFFTGASRNTTGYSNPAVDTALEKTRTAAEPAAQTEAYKEATRQLAADAAFQPWYYPVAQLLFPKKIHGVVPAYTYFMRPDLVWRES
ncbi:ABC transporter substrate-binding protein [Acrocarpospora catenulata]|uniref:ABC transporter substrate-binding protein n=1 Tax=Acrocarpospora catenulata TaxID=2836182 RepID=UPI001BD9D5EC|nr:ABC transporter substrate-binding protein [Acrocarpospora catenulata]